MDEEMQALYENQTWALVPLPSDKNLSTETLSFLVMLSLVALGLCRSVASQAGVFDVTAYGAVGDANTDDSPAFVKAWSAACGASGASTLIIPSQKTFRLKPLELTGKCTASTIQIQIDGNLVAPNTREAFGQASKWILIHSVDSLTITGSGQLDGQGAIWWPKNCFHRKLQGCPVDFSRPTLLSFESCNNLKLSGTWKLINSPRNHISVDDCNNVNISQIGISAPGYSPNTDGINIGKSNHLSISNLNIASGDDCISILSGVSDVNITSVTCGPGHGISIGSLGEGNREAFVSQINVEHCTFDKTQNGARIKTRPGGSGYAKNIGFRHLEMKEVEHPILIDQYYSDTMNTSSAVAVSEVDFLDIRGTGVKEQVVSLACSLSIPCQAIRLSEVYLATTVPGKTASAYCLKVDGPPCTNCSPIISIPC
ncbi:probable polygalacturonase At3g15720 [Aristolochia californica]|uniref:probable polygalacturonase At3g15720 n=1 Tax=Aristolochia californica TaxID=171875 RepID=UPI0035DD81A9